MYDECWWLDFSQAFDAHENPDLETDDYMRDIQCVASLCKMYFRYETVEGGKFGF